MRFGKRLVALFMVFTFAFANLGVANVSAAKKPKLSKTSVSINVGALVKLKVKNGKGTWKWSTSNKKVATVKKGKVTGVEEGTAVITAKKGKTKLTCKVKVISDTEINTSEETTESTQNKPTTEASSTTEDKNIIKSDSIKKVDATTFDNKVKEIDAVIDKVKNSKVTITKSDTFIQGETYTKTAYYLSENGDDYNDGMSEASAWKTIDRLNKANLSYGDAVFFHRGDTFRGSITCSAGVTYAAYGDGPKPVITGSPENAGDASKWKLYGSTADGGKVWEYYKDITDCGNIYFDNEPAVNHRIAPSRKDGKFIDDSGNEFDVLKGLNEDLMFVSFADSKLPFDMTGFVDVESQGERSVGKLYLRCDKGNPGDTFKSIEFGTLPKGFGAIFKIDDGVKYSSIIDLNLKYSCTCGVMTCSSENYLVKNCEISCIGGYVINYKNGVPERCGDGMCLSGGNCTIDSNYIHDCCDSGITIECGYSNDFRTFNNYRIINNAIMPGAGNNIHFAIFNQDLDNPILFSNIEIAHNYLYMSNNSWAFPFRGVDYGNGIKGGSCLGLGEGELAFYTERLSIHDNVIYSENSGAIEGWLYKNIYSIFKNNTILFSDPKYPVAILRTNNEYMDWYRLNGQDLDGVKFLNETIGSDNTFVVKSK